MVRITAFPTIEWLSKRGAAPLDVQTVPAGGSSERYREELSTRIEGYLNAWKNEHSIVSTDAWVGTPNGEEHVDIVLAHRGRRIGIRLAGPYEEETHQTDAIVLVYGRFDVVYRIHYSGPSMPAADLAFAIQSAHPSWFSAEGRIAAGRLVSSEILIGAQRLNGTLHLESMRLTRIRLSHASDWVEAFESALSVPRLRSFADDPTRASRTFGPNRSRSFLREPSCSTRKPC